MHDHIYACDRVTLLSEILCSVCFIQQRDHPVHDHIYIYIYECDSESLTHERSL